MDSHKIPFTFKVGTALFSHSGYWYPVPGRIFAVSTVGEEGDITMDSLNIPFTF